MENGTERLRGEDGVMERLTYALVDLAAYQKRYDGVPRWRTSRGPMRRKLSRLHREGAQALRNARAFDRARADRIWRNVEREMHTTLLFSSTDLDREE